MLKLLFSSILFGISYCEEAVHTLTQQNFDSFISQHPDGALVEFYAPWCGHCKALAPEYEKAAEMLGSDNSIKTVLAKVDATEEKDLATKYGIRGFPTLKYFTGDSETPAEYSGGRTADTIVQWLSVRALPAVSELSSKDDVETFKQKGKVTLVGYLSDAKQQKALSKVAEDMRDSLIIGQVSSEDTAKEVNAKMGTVHLYASWNEEATVLDGEWDKKKLIKFINSERFPLIDAIGPENYKDYMDRGLPLVWVSVDGSDDDMVDKVNKALTPRAKDFKGELSFVTVDNVKYNQHVTNLGITSTPGLIIIGEPQKFLYKGDLYNEEELKKFFDDYKDDKLEVYLKSQEIPESNDEPVYVLVGKDFNNVVGKDKDVFVEFYAPWCGHCKRLAPEYEKVGEAFKDVKDVVIAKIDATENDTPEDIKGFPTLIFYPKGKTTGTKYNGDRTAEGIISWIKDEATVDVAGLKEDL